MQLQTSMHFKRQLLFDNNNSNHKHDLLYMISWALRAMKSCQQIMHMISTHVFVHTLLNPLIKYRENTENYGISQTSFHQFQ